MENDAFADSAVERAANSGGAAAINNAEWPPANIVHYDYDAHLSPDNSLVDMNLDEDPVMLGDIKSAEEVSLLSGDIDMADQYKQHNRNRNKISAPFKQRNNNKQNKNKQKSKQHIIIQQASGLKGVFDEKLRSQTKQQQNMHKMPSFESNIGISAWCISLFYWIPIRYLCFCGSFALFILPFFDVKFQTDLSFIEWLLYWYIQLFAIVGIFVESPTWILTKKIQLIIYKWCRLLRRTWGRAAFYISVSFLTFAELQGGAMITLSMFAGIYMTGLSLIMIVFSLLAAKQYRLMYTYMATGQSEKLVGDEYGNDENMDYEKLESRVSSYFTELDSDGDGRIGAGELHQFAERALRRSLSNSERYTIQNFLDCSCNGYVSKEDWIKQFCNYNQVRFL